MPRKKATFHASETSLPQYKSYKAAYRMVKPIDVPLMSFYGKTTLKQAGAKARSESLTNEETKGNLEKGIREKRYISAGFEEKAWYPSCCVCRLVIQADRKNIYLHCG